MKLTLKGNETLGSGISNFGNFGLKKFLDKKCDRKVSLFLIVPHVKTM